MRNHSSLIHVGLVILVALGGCASTPKNVDEAAKRRMLSLLMPNRIEIVEPFTRVRSFDDDASPDGIELLLQAVNSLDNPGLMVVGEFLVELYEHVPASGDQKGARVERWNVPLETAEQQRMYWNQITQMYEFRLAVDPSALPADEKYVLLVTYNSPLDDHLTDECIITRHSSALPLGGARRSGR